jgi:hypothetical protein
MVCGQDRCGFNQVLVAAEEARVEIAEGGESKGGRLAAASVGFNVSADGGFHFLAPEVRLVPPLPHLGYFGDK